MMSTLNAIGLAIGWIDIFGALLFELMILYMMRKCCNANGLKQDVEQPDEVGGGDNKSKQCKRKMTPKLYGHGYLRENPNSCIFWGYLLLLNVWIVVTLVMMAGIILHKPQLMILWILWCIVGLVFDVFFLLWWFYELVAGDSIEALTNIMISVLTMVIEFGFIYVIYSIYDNSFQSSKELAKGDNVTLPVFSYLF